jgi:hypothetical protein
VVAKLPALVVGLNEPQAFKGVHDQVTPELVASPTTRAVSVVVVPGFRIAGGAGFNVTEIAPAIVMVILADADAEGFCTAVAVTSTVPPLGIAAGAVYVVVTVVHVLVVGLNEPQAFAGRHVQVTPELVGSFTTTAVSVVVVPVAIEAGVGWSETEMGGGALIVMVAVADCVGSLIDVAVTVTEPPVGIAVGAV